MDSQIAGIAALYIVVELLKYLLPSKESETHQIVEDIHQWMRKTDDDGRMLIYTPKVISVDMGKVLETLRTISSNQEKIALLLDQMSKKD